MLVVGNRFRRDRVSFIRRLAIGDGGGGQCASVDADIAEGADDFEDFAAGGEHAAVGSLVGVQRLHEFDFFARVIAFARGGINLTTTRHLASLGRASLDIDRLVALSTVRSFATVSTVTTVILDVFEDLGHCQILPEGSGDGLAILAGDAYDHRKSSLGKSTG